MHDIIPLACQILFHLKLMWDDKGARVYEVGQNTKVGVLGGHISQCALIRFSQFFLSGSPICLLNPYVKIILGFSRIKHVQTITMW